ncbi:MAG: hypothetical protein IKR34_03990 [Candidatus Gastranaerophilales bacterium]|nr:hypothetical protein [Candidatus Gastranaerophilales bacterium]
MKRLYDKNYLLCNQLITKSMLKRRKLAYSSISKICDSKSTLKVVK